MSEALQGDISREFYAILEHLQMAEFLCFIVVFFCNENFCAIFGVVVASEFHACVCVVVCVCVLQWHGQQRRDEEDRGGWGGDGGGRERGNHVLCASQSWLLAGCVGNHSEGVTSRSFPSFARPT